MSEHVTDVMVAGYLAKESALLDYEAVVNSGAKIEGIVAVSRDLEGKVTIEITDHLKRKGAVGLGAAGFVVGLFAPPLLLSAASVSPSARAWAIWRKISSRARLKCRQRKQSRGVALG